LPDLPPFPGIKAGEGFFFMTALAALSRLSKGVDRWVTRFTVACAWFNLLSLIAVTSLDVAIRQIAHVGSDKLKEIESSLFLALVMTSLGYTYLRDGHVRIDIFREKMSVRTRAWVELAGCLTILLPISAILVYHGGDSALTAFWGGDKLEAFADLPIQWVVKSTVPLGYLLLFLSGMGVMVRNILFLLRREAESAPQGDFFAQDIHKRASDSR
jgi:TRAP-type mannitol/chloroaromatic compound transport system permease small subunit